MTTSTSSETCPFHVADLGTLVVMAWSGAAPDGDMPTTRPWPAAEPGKPVDPDTLAAFAGAEETLKAAAHVPLPARSLLG